MRQAFFSWFRLFSATLGVVLSLSARGKTPAAFSSYPADTAIAGASSYENPVWDHDFPDPNLVRAPDGYFYAYATDVNWREDGMGGPYTVPVLRSKDLVHWQLRGDAFDKRPRWKKGGIWAPDVTYYDHRYIMFYSFSTWGDPDPAIGVAVSNTPEGPFTDRGALFYSKEIGVDNSIDPFLIVDGGTPYLVWGSFHGIYGVPLSPDATKVAGEKFRIAGDRFEGSYIYKRGKYYYYFGSAGSCCDGARSTYHIYVGRALSLRGPYYDKKGRSLLEGGGTLLLEANDGPRGFVGTGHNGDIETDDAGQTWMVYHAIDKTRPGHKTGGTRRPMLLDKIVWRKGWPVIKGRQPGLGAEKGPVFR